MMTRVLFLSLALLVGVTAQQPNPLACPAEPPSEQATCSDLPDLAKCNYNYFNCPGGGGTYGTFCTCSGGRFFCGTAQPCAPVASLYTSFPSSAPSEAPVSPDTAEVVPAEPTGPWTYTTPSWWATMKAADETGDLKQCAKRQFPATEGSRCAKRSKICYWGEQTCATVGPHPTMKCSCDGVDDAHGSWSCEAESCPV